MKTDRQKLILELISGQSVATQQQLLELLAPDYINGLTVLGGEPFEPANQTALLPFLRRVREAYPQKTIWAFTGFTYEELRTPEARPCCPETEELLSLLDVLVDGPFVLAERSLTLPFRGSRNQRLIDVKASLAAGETVIRPD